MVMVDYHSSFPEIARLGSTTSAAVVNHIKSVFARYGVPREVVSDNGAQFSVEGFARFANEYGFDHRTSSPLHPEANGKAEKAVGVVKNLLNRAKDSGGDPYLALLAYRQAPLEAGRSPAELLMGRCLQESLPRLVSSLVGETEWKERQEKVASRQARSYNRGAKDLDNLEKGEIFRICGNGWDRKAVVMRKVNPRSYVVRTEGVVSTGEIGVT